MDIDAIELVVPAAIHSHRGKADSMVNAQFQKVAGNLQLILCIEQALPRA
jgi:hypothetical protein